MPSKEDPKLWVSCIPALKGPGSASWGPCMVERLFPQSLMATGLPREYFREEDEGARG